MEVLTVKIIAMVLLGAVSLLLGLVPMLFKRSLQKEKTHHHKHSKTDYVISGLSCFGGGVVLATCFAHMLPEVREFLAKNVEAGLFPDTGMSMAEIIVLCGFYMIYIVEEITHLLLDKCQVSSTASPEKVKSLGSLSQSKA